VDIETSGPDFLDSRSMGVISVTVLRDELYISLGYSEIDLPRAFRVFAHALDVMTVNCLSTCSASAALTTSLPDSLELAPAQE